MNTRRPRVVPARTLRVRARAAFTLIEERPVVVLDDGLLRIDLSRGRAPSAPPGEAEPVRDAPAPRRLSVVARPLHVGPLEFEAELDLAEPRFVYARDGNGGLRLDLDGSEGGRLELVARRDRLERASLDALTALGRKHGVRIVDVRLELAGDGEQGFRANLLVTARKLFKAKVRALGRFAVREPLLLRISEAEAKGEGFLGPAVESLVGPTVKAFHGKELSFAEFLPKGIVPARIRIDAGGDLKVTARIEPS